MPKKAVKTTTRRPAKKKVGPSRLPGNGTLLAFFADVLRDNDLLDRFLQNPDQVARDYKLGTEQVRTISTTDPGLVAQAIAAETRNNLFGVIREDWPAPEAEIRKITPLQIAPNTSTKLKIEASALMRGAILICTSLESRGKTYEYKVSAPRGEFERRTANASVKLAAGNYRLAIENCEGAKLLPAPATLKVS
jgi:hypothetical protein